MLLNNYWAYKTYIDSHNFSYGSNNYGIVPGVIPNNYNDLAIYTYANSTEYINEECKNRSLKYNISCDISNDTNTIITPTMIDLPSKINSNFGSYTVNKNHTLIDGKEVTTFTISGINTTSSSITITKIGIYKNINCSYTRTNTQKVYFAIEELEEPITVPSNRGFRLVFEWTEQ